MTLKQAKRGSMEKWERGLKAWNKGYKAFKKWWINEGSDECDLCAYAIEKMLKCNQCVLKGQSRGEFLGCTQEWRDINTWMWENDECPPKTMFIAMYNRVKEIQED